MKPRFCYLVAERYYEVAQCNEVFRCSGCQGDGTYDDEDPFLIRWRIAFSDDLEMKAYLRRLTTYEAEHPEQRKGQAAFNVLAELEPELADSVRAVPGLDPFYVDDYLPNFFRYVWARITP